jgi:hypothetical protein
VGLVLTVGLLAGGCAHHIFDDFLCLPDCARKFREGEQLARELEAQSEWTRARIDAKVRVIRELVQGERTLRDAAGQFRAMDRDVKNHDLLLERLRETIPGRTDEERYCRSVITWVSGELPRNSDETEAVVRRLEAELDELVRQGVFSD